MSGESTSYLNWAVLTVYRLYHPALLGKVIARDNSNYRRCSAWRCFQHGNNYQEQGCVMYIVIKGPLQCGKLDVCQMDNSYSWEQPLGIEPIVWNIHQ